VKPLLVSLLAVLPRAAPPQATIEPARADAGALLAALAIAEDEREERFALALSLALGGDCEGALARLGASSGSDDELGRRIAVECTRLAAWIELRDSFLAELASSGKPLAIELDGKKVSTGFRREGDELVLARAPRARLSVRELAPEALLPAIPKERFAGAKEWLKIYPYCLAANPKWKRLTTSEASSAELKRDAEEFYPRLAQLGPSVRALEHLAGLAPPTDRASAQAVLAEIQVLVALGREQACVRARIPRLKSLAGHLLALVSGAMELGELVHAEVGSAGDGTTRFAYDFTSAPQALDWRRDDAYLAGLRTALEPVTAEGAEGSGPDFPVGAAGFRANGEFCWQHVLEFEAPLRVRYKMRWEASGKASKVFAFALGMLADEGERHVRVAELGFLYVDEQDGPYTAVRPTGNPSVKTGQVYALELAHDGQKAVASVDGVARAEAEAAGRKSGRVFLWGHSDLPISISALEIEGRLTPDSLAMLRAEWEHAELGRLGLGP
jgi:hypothetical protein